MTYHYAIRRNGLLLTRTLTHGKAVKVAVKYPGSVVVSETFTKGGTL